MEGIPSRRRFDVDGRGQVSTTTAFNSTLSSLWSMSGTIQAIRSASAEACAPLARSRRAIRSASAEACAAGLTESGMLMSHPK